MSIASFFYQYVDEMKIVNLKDLKSEYHVILWFVWGQYRWWYIVLFTGDVAEYVRFQQNIGRPACCHNPDWVGNASNLLRIQCDAPSL